MTARRTIATVLLVAAVAALLATGWSFVQERRVAAIDDEAYDLALIWRDGPATAEGQEALTTSNERYREARALEDTIPFDPMTAAGVALLLVAAGIGAWPSRAHAAQEEPAST